MKLIATTGAICALAIPGAALAESYQSSGTPAQIAWVRRAAGNFLGAELSRNGAGACAILEGGLRASVAHRTCTQRWDARLGAMLAQPGGRARLRADRRALSTSRVVVYSARATIALPNPLFDGASHLRWTENCWMLTR